MTIVLDKQLEEAAAVHAGLSQDGWLKRSDELFDRQKTLFLELLTFARDEKDSPNGKTLSDYLSARQYVGDSIADGGFPAFAKRELAEAVRVATAYFREQEKQGNSGPTPELGPPSLWRQPFVWNRCVQILQTPEVQSSPLLTDVTITLWAVTDLYANRFTELLEHQQSSYRN